MALIEINRNPSPRELLRFTALLPVAGLVFGAAVWFWTRSIPAASALAAALTVAGLLGLAIPSIRRALYLGWMYLFLPVGLIFGTLLLAAVFYLVVAPIGLLVRSFIGDPLNRRFDPAATTYWTRRPTAPPAERYFRQY